jgi:hypothetical protein
MPIRAMPWRHHGGKKYNLKPLSLGGTLYFPWNYEVLKNPM